MSRFRSLLSLAAVATVAVLMAFLLPGLMERDASEPPPGDEPAGLPQAGKSVSGDPEPGAALDPGASLPESPGEDSAIHILIEGTGEYVDWPSRTPASKRTEIVHLNASLLSEEPSLRKGDRLGLSFHDGKAFKARVTTVSKWGNGSVGISGKLEEDPAGRLFLSYSGERASVIVKRPDTDATYQILYDRGHGAYLALDVDEERTDFLECGADEIRNPVPAVSGHSHAPVASAPDAAAAAGSFEDTVTLDVLVVYTPAARGDSGSTAQIEADISQAILIGNDVHQNSDTRIQLNLVHTEEVSYTEESPETDDSPGNYLDDITYLAGDLVNDSEVDPEGDLDSVHILRDTHEADFVVFVVKTNETGGLAWRPSAYDRDDLAFSLVRGAQVASNTLVHEIGHNMGLGHSATQVVQPFTGGIYAYAAGWQWADGSSPASIGYCSVMTYQNFDGNSGNGDEYRRVSHFSNPDIAYNGNPTGDAIQADASRVLRNGRFDYSGYRGAKAVPAVGIHVFPDVLGFETYFGSWYQPDTDDFDWTRNSGGTPTPSSGPSGASEGAYYAYLEASGRNPGDAAVLFTRLDLSNHEHAAISFDYHMYGFSMGSLFLEASPDNGASWVGLWSRSGDQGTAWLPAQADLSAYDGTEVSLRFRAVRGPNFASDISLDNLVITADAASGETFASWIGDTYPGLADPTPEGDPDMDGISNFLEYALGLAPDTPDAAGAPEGVHDPAAETLSISFRRAREGVRYVIESTPNPNDWNAAIIEWDSDLAPVDLVAVGEVQTVTVPMPPEGRLFLRVEATE